MNKKFALNPNKLFLVDGLGALLTAFLLFVIMKRFNEYFGAPQTTLACLCILALVFSFYSITCFFLLKDNWQPFLRAIIVANLLYCCLTAGLVFYSYPGITTLGIIYFLGEIIIILGLVFIELKTLKGSVV